MKYYWHHRLSGLEFEQAPGDGEGQRSLVCCSPWGHKEPDKERVTEQQQLATNRNELLIHAPAWMNLENTLLSERCQSQKATYYMILVI